MVSMHKAAARGMAILAVAATAACSSTGGLGNILGGVLGQQGQGQVSGTVRSVDTRYQQIQLQQSNGQNVTLGYDNQTQVVYQNQNYSVSNLEYGDQVTARIANNNTATTALTTQTSSRSTSPCRRTAERERAPTFSSSREPPATSTGQTESFS